MSETMKDECQGVGESRCHIAECRSTRVCQRPITPAPDHAQAREDAVLPILSRMYEDARNDLPTCDWIEGVVRRALAASPPVAPVPPVVTDEMCIAALREDQAQRGESFDALREELSDKDKAESIEDMRHVILAALAERPRG